MPGPRRWKIKRAKILQASIEEKPKQNTDFMLSADQSELTMNDYADGFTPARATGVTLDELMYSRPAGLGFAPGFVSWLSLLPPHLRLRPPPLPVRSASAPSSVLQAGLRQRRRRRQCISRLRSKLHRVRLRLRQNAIG